MVIVKRKKTERFNISLEVEIKKHGKGVNAEINFRVVSRSMKCLLDERSKKFLPGISKALEYVNDYFSTFEIPTEFNEINVSWETSKSLASELISVLFAAYTEVDSYIEFYESFCK